MSKLDEILNQPMSRKKFIQTIGMGILALVGVSSLMGILTPNKSTENQNLYGRRNYGP